MAYKISFGNLNCLKEVFASWKQHLVKVFNWEKPEYCFMWNPMLWNILRYKVLGWVET